MGRLLDKLKHHYDNPNYLYLLLSQILLIILPPLADIYQLGVIAMDITYGLVILIAIIFTATSFRQLVVFGIVGGINYLLFLVYNFSDTYLILGVLFTLIFFSLVFRNIVYYILKMGKVTVNEIYACSAGYLLLGVIGSSIFFLLSQSFDVNLSDVDPSNFYDHLYFSYITITAVGYGDIIPHHPIAKTVSIIFGIAGQLYLTILVAVIIGRYLVSRNK